MCGANGTIGVARTARAMPDGYTIDVGRHLCPTVDLLGTAFRKPGTWIFQLQPVVGPTYRPLSDARRLLGAGFGSFLRPQVVARPKCIRRPALLRPRLPTRRFGLQDQGIVGL